jgi:hypothetical protein
MLTFGGCAGPGSIVPHRSTLEDVRAAMGNPTDVRRAPNGDQLWEFARGPRGTETYLIRADREGRVISVTQLLTQEQFAKIVPNQTTKAEVRELLGRPSEELSLYSGLTWTWRVYVGPQDGHFVVRFRPDDVVLEASLLIDMGRDRDRRGLLGNPLHSCGDAVRPAWPGIDISGHAKRNAVR